MKRIWFSVINLSLIFLVFTICISCEKISSIWSESNNKDSLFSQIEGMYPAYNKKELKKYCDYFSDEINVFKEQGLGNTRIINGKDQFWSYYQRIFKTKALLKITPLSYFEVYPWIMVKELVENENDVFEAAVGYRLENGKIRDRMILSENFLVNKGKVSVDIPQPKKTDWILPPPYDPEKMKEDGNK